MFASYDSRYRPKYGYLRPEAEQAFESFKRCGDPHFGVTVFRCESCEVNLGVPFSCKARICPSCLARKAEERALFLKGAVPEVPHRHLVFGLPKKMGIRQRVREDPKLLRKVTTIVNRTLVRHLRSCLQLHRHEKDKLKKSKPGIIVAQHTWGDTLNYHPHLHICITDGLLTKENDFLNIVDWRQSELKDKLRRKVLTALVKWQKLTPQAADIVACWPIEQCGFSLFIGSSIPASDRDGLANLLRYLMRSPCSLKRLSYDESDGKVSIGLKNGQKKVFTHACDFLAALAQHIPKARLQTVTYAGYYANATGNLSKKLIEDETVDELHKQSTEAKTQRYIPWSKLVIKSWGVDPELCPKCGEQMSRKKPISEQSELQSLLKPLNLWGYPTRPPPAPIPEMSFNEGSSPKSAVENFDNVVHLFPENDLNQCPPGW